MDFEKLGKNLAAFWKLFSNHPVPRFVFVTVCVGALILGVLFLIAKVKETIARLFRGDAEEKRRIRRRRRFAVHVSTEIDRIDTPPDWSDHKFSELEAEVEAEGHRRRVFGFRRQPTLRREGSLSRALQASRERLILLEGEPGAGKSVALRHLAVVLASSAAKSRNARSIVPLYINLKSIDCPSDKHVDVALIREHVLKTLNRANDSAVEDFLNDEFARGLEEGTWLFLFDSFDEIPDILSATAADTWVREYADAISTFLQGLNTCRGIVASRYFRGPGALGWPRFRILALSDEHRRRLIQRADLPGAIEVDLISRLELTGPELAVTSRNPMFLALLCQHVAKGNPFPENTHVVFEDYVDTRLRRDEGKLIRRFSVGPTQVREAAEQAAFCMAYHPTLGLSPSRAALAAAMSERGYTGDAMTMFDALEFIKLASAESGAVDPPFTFAHRRFQEYFATSVVLHEDIVTPERLLTDARWRETAVVLLQTQSGERLERIVATIGELLERVVALVERAMPEDVPAIPLKEPQPLDRSMLHLVRDFPWPPLTLHLLSLLQSGYQGRASAAPDYLRDLVGRIVLLATDSGTLTDRKWALEVAGIAPAPILTAVIRDAFAGGSRWLGEVAYRQAALLPVVPPDIAWSIRRALKMSFVSGRLRRERDATYAHLRRLPQNAQFVDAARLLISIPPIDFALHGFLLAMMMREANTVLSAVGMAVALAILAVAPYLVRQVWLTDGTGLWAAIGFIVSFRLLIVMFIAGPPGCGVLLIAIPILLWPGFALAAAGAGQFTGIVWWPILSAFPLLFAMRAIGVAVRNGLNQLRRVKFRKPTVSELLGVGLVLAAIVLLQGGQFDSFLRGKRVTALGDELAKFIGGVFLTLSFGVVFIIFARQIAVEIYDNRLWKREVKHAQHFEDVEQLVKLLRRFRARGLQLVERVRSESMLEPSAANELSIRRVAIEFENEPTENQKLWLAQKTVLERGRFWWKQFWEFRSDVDMRMIDALNILAEQLRTRRAI